MFRITDVVKHLLIINVLMFLASMIFNTDMFALYYPGSEKFQPFQLVTHFFMHANIGHIFFNMFALVMFGSAIETLWGPKKFLFFYIFCALGAAALHLGYTYYEFSQLFDTISEFKKNPSSESFYAFFSNSWDYLTPEYQERISRIERSLDNNVTREVVQTGASTMESLVRAKMDIPMVGASGAIFGLLLAFGMFFPNAELMLIFFPVPIKAKYFIPILMVVELFLGVNRFSWDNIAHFAHLGGALFGWLLILYWRRFGSRFDEK